MKKISLCIAAAVVLLLSSMNLSAQPAMSVGVGLDLMLPVGSFGDNWKAGFGGSAEFDYVVKPTLTLTGKIGYLTWSGKDKTVAASATYSGVPVLVGGKYYFRFMPQGEIRGYGHLELGIMFGSISVTGSRLIGSSSTSDFTIVPSVGAEIPAGGNGKIDFSLRYFDISSKGSIGFRAAYEFAI